MQLLRSEHDEVAQGYIKSDRNVPDRLIAHFPVSFVQSLHVFYDDSVRISTIFPGWFRDDFHKLSGTNPIDLAKLFRQILANLQKCTA